MSDSTAYVCGQWLPFSQVRIDPLDRPGRRLAMKAIAGSQRVRV
jgi:hypothetical protein